MPNYTVKNLKQITNAAEQFGLADNLEARFARKPLELENLGISYQRLEPNFRIPFGHKHGVQEELYVIISGTAHVKVDDDVVELKQWDAIRVPADATRNFEAGPEGVEYLAIGAPHDDDTDMVQEWWAD